MTFERGQCWGRLRDCQPTEGEERGLLACSSWIFSAGGKRGVFLWERRAHLKGLGFLFLWGVRSLWVGLKLALKHLWRAFRRRSPTIYQRALTTSGRVTLPYPHEKAPSPKMATIACIFLPKTALAVTSAPVFAPSPALLSKSQSPPDYPSYSERPPEKVLHHPL